MEKKPIPIPMDDMVVVVHEILVRRTQQTIDTISEHIPKDKKLRLIVIYQVVFAYHIHILFPILSKKYNDDLVHSFYKKLLDYSMRYFDIIPEEQSQFCEDILDYSDEFINIIKDPKSKDGFGTTYNLAKLVITQCKLSDYLSDMQFIFDISTLIAANFKYSNYLVTDYEIITNTQDEPKDKSQDNNSEIIKMKAWATLGKILFILLLIGLSVLMFFLAK